MYIVQYKNIYRHRWHELPQTNCKFKSLDKAIKLYKEIKVSPHYSGCSVRIWSTEADHYVEVEA